MLGDGGGRAGHPRPTVAIVMRRTPTLGLLLLLLLLTPNATANECKFPESWNGRWFQYGKEGPVIVNSTHLLDRKCIENNQDTYITYEENPADSECYRCMLFTERDVNVIQYRESFCFPHHTSIDFACQELRSDDSLNSMFRLDSKPIPCPFAGPPFSFSYNRGHGECKALENQVESCTDESKLLLKYQACADIQGAESSTEELQCLAVWKDGRNMYLLGTLKVAGSEEETFRCFLYEKIHRDKKIGYLISQSGDPSCNGLTSVTEGAPTFNFTKEEKEHVRCKYPSWVTQHHDWHFLDGSRNYHFTTGNSTLKVTFKDDNREEKVVCHNLEKMHPSDETKVKLVAHVTSGCDTGYVCMIFYKRDGHVIEVQQSSHKTIMPHEACLLEDPSKRPFSTLITSTLHKRSCPQPGRYTVLDLVSSPQLKMARRHRRFARGLAQSSWKESNEATGNVDSDDCQNADVQIGCTSSGQNEMIIQESCKTNEMAYSCHGSWEENGTSYTIVSRNKTNSERETLCVSMRLTESTKELPGKVGRVEQQELWLSRPRSFCQRGATDQWTYKLANQGVCEEVMRAASSSASSSSPTRVSLVLSIGLTLLCSVLSR